MDTCCKNYYFCNFEHLNFESVGKPVYRPFEVLDLKMLENLKLQLDKLKNGAFGKLEMGIWNFENWKFGNLEINNSKILFFWNLAT